jgi:hypothetical protein
MVSISACGSMFVLAITSHNIVIVRTTHCYMGSSVRRNEVCSGVRLVMESESVISRK